MGKSHNLKGLRFGKWTVLHRIRIIGAGHSFWACRCDCGTETDVNTSKLLRGESTQCKTCARVAINTTHDMSKSYTYVSWQKMHTRCRHNPRYLDKGITVCARWSSFENFFKDMGERPEGKSIDRRNNDKGYYKTNCRWATPLEQQNNTCITRLITYRGETMSLRSWAKKFNLAPSTIRQRLAHGWPLDMVFMQTKLSRYDVANMRLNRGRSSLRPTGANK